jgi:tRNA-dihydrouridine synthase B
MKIGDVDLKHKLIVAPMAEITDAPFRIISKRYGAGLTFTQMVSAQGVVRNDFNTLRLLSFPKSEKPIGVQLLGNDPYYLKAAVNELHHFKPDIIDLNCGCPVDKVTKKNMGASLLDDPKNLGKLVKSMVEGSSDIPISVKIRLGRDSKNTNAIDNIKAAEDNGAVMVTLHTRYRVDRYDQDAKWEWIPKIKNEVKIPIVANGSVFEPIDAVKLIKEFGSDSVMVARGALGNPFFFKRYNALMETGKDPGLPSIKEVCELSQEHLTLLVGEYGEHKGVNKAKKHIIWYFKNLPGAKKIIEDIFRFTDAKSLADYISDHANKIENGQFEILDKDSINNLFYDKVQFWLHEESNVTS